MRFPANERFLASLILVGIFPFFFNAFVNAALAPMPALFWAWETLIWVAMPLVIFAVAFRKGGLRFSELGLHAAVRGTRRPVLLVILCITAGIAFLTVYILAAMASYSVFPKGGVFSYRTVVPAEGAARALVVTYLALTAGFVEEMYFRGLMWRICSFSDRPRSTYLALSAMLFALIHWENGPAEVVATCIVGVVAACAYLAIRNLWPLIAGHVFTDFLWFQVTSVVSQRFSEENALNRRYQRLCIRRVVWK